MTMFQYTLQVLRICSSRYVYWQCISWSMRYRRHIFLSLFIHLLPF